MAAERCEKCGGERVRRSAAPWRHALRVILSSHKRCCLDCGTKWHVLEDSLSPSGPPVSPHEVMLLASLIAVVAVVFLDNGGLNPLRALKQVVRSHYDEKYGAESKTRLWEDWGWLYFGRRGAQTDYSGHSKE